ncbi:MAG: CHAT domain-containing protein [Thermoguttaceae bacterium]
MKSRISCQHGGFHRPALATVLVLGGILTLSLSSRPAAGQTGLRGAGSGATDRTVPTKAYHAAFADFYDGDYRSALEHFKADSATAIRTSQSRWIDSICYETMQGECYYQMGMYPDALAHYTNALELFQAFPNWLSQVAFAAIRADIGVKKLAPWQLRRLQAPLGQVPYTMLLGQGQVDISSQVRQGGIVESPNLFPVEPQEIVRCTALAIRRRGELLGPLAAHDPLIDSIIAALQRRPGQPNHWSEAWVNLELGLALSAGGRAAAAVPILQQATIASGQFEHPLTAMAHLELGRLAMAAGDSSAAAAHFEEATYASYYFTDVNHLPDLDVMEEAFRYGALNHLLANGKGIFSPLALAAGWAKTNHFRQLYASLLTSAAENHLSFGQTQQAMAFLEDARTSIGNKTMGNGRLGARRMFLEATAFYQARKAAEGDAILAKVMHFLRTGSLWLFQMQKVDDYYTGGGGGGVSAARAAIDLYQVVLRDPQPADWLTDPMESLASLGVPHGLIYEHWFEAAVDRKDHELAVEVADRARRHRFLSTLPFGGRLESLRWVLEGPKELLPPQALLQRQALLSRYPNYQDLLDQAAVLRRDLAAMPLVQADAEKTKKQGQAMTRFKNIGRDQEIVLHEMAVRRDPAAIAFPPLKTTTEIQKALPPGQALLAFFATSRNLYAFLLSHDKYATWQVASTQQTLARQSAVLLREFGNFSQNYELTSKDLADGKWRQTARELLDGLLKGSRADFATKFDELIIVPDGLLWYVPFEALQVQVDGQPRPLISRFRIRYAPTAALAVATLDAGRRRGNTAIVVGKLHAKLDDEAVENTVKDLSKSLAGCVTLKMPLPASSPIYANFIDRLLVLDELSPAAQTDPYGWSPLPTERTKIGGPLLEWFLLPRRGPDEVILPGYHTACETSLKKVDAARRTGRSVAADALGPGNEIFLSLCGLMSTGTRTILISRWRSGGQSSLDLVREFTQELPHTTPSDAWQRAVLVVSNSPVNSEAEPRIKKSSGEHADRDVAEQTAHPFFWAGYLLADSGSPQPKPEAKK